MSLNTLRVFQCVPTITTTYNIFPIFVDAHQPNVIRTIRVVNGNSKRADRKCLTFDRKKFKMHWNHCNCCWCNRFRCRESKLYGREKVIFLFKMRWKKYSEIELLNIYTSSKVFMCLARTCSFSLTFSLSPLYLALSNFSLFFSPFPLSLFRSLSISFLSLLANVCNY